MKISVRLLLVLCISFSLFWLSSPAQDTLLEDVPDHKVEGNTYVNKTHQCQVSIFKDTWKITTQFEELGDGVSVAEFDESDYGAWGVLAISKFPQKDLADFVGKGEYNAEKAKYTFIAGKKAYAASKKIERGGFDITSQVYKFVHNNMGYIFSFGFLSQWDEDEDLQKQIDQVLNSFVFSDEKVVVQQLMKDKKNKKEKISDVAMLGMIDLKSGKENADTQILTNELQSHLYRSGQFEFIERRKLDKVIEEQKLQLTGVISDKSAIKIGEISGAKFILSSSIGLLGETSVIYAQITNAENGKIISSASVRVNKASKDDLLDAVPGLVSNLIFE